MHPIRSFAILSPLLPLLLASAADAQVIRGRLFDDVSGLPVGGAGIELVRPPNSTVLTVVTSADGRFALELPQPGAFRIRASQLAYRTIESSELTILGNDTIDVEIVIHPTALLLNPLTVTAATRIPLGARLQEEFHQRQRRGVGRFLGPEAVRERDGFNTSDIFSAEPGMRVRRGPGGGSAVVLMRGTFGWCEPAVYVDGFRLRTDIDFTLDAAVSGGDVQAVEMYRRFSDVPAQFAAGGHFGCGAIVIWTTRSFGYPPDSRTGR
jgi:hypothetical protein